MACATLAFLQSLSVFSGMLYLEATSENFACGTLSCSNTSSFRSFSYRRRRGFLEAIPTTASRDPPSIPCCCFFPVCCRFLLAFFFFSVVSISLTFLFFLLSVSFLSLSVESMEVFGRDGIDRGEL